MTGRSAEFAPPSAENVDHARRAATKLANEAHHPQHQRNANSASEAAIDHSSKNPRKESIRLDDGTSRSLTYDQSGQLAAVTNPDGSGFYKNEGKWQELGTDGSYRPLNGAITLDDKHNVSVDTGDGSFKLTTHGSKIVYDQNKNPIEIDYANHKSALIKWDSKSHISEIDMPDGSVAHPGDYSSPAARALKPEISDDGYIEFSSLDGSNSVLANGSTYRYDGAGNLLERNLAGDKTKYFYDRGVLTHVAGPGKEDWQRDSATGVFHDQSGTNSKTKTTAEFFKFIAADQLYGKDPDQNTPEQQAKLMPKSSEVSQGGIGDCYFLSTLAGLADTNPQAIKDMIKDNKNGTYTVTFPGDKNNPVTVDAPTIQEQALYATNDKGAGQWAGVMEKAHRYYTGRVNRDNGDNAKNAVKLLTGNTASMQMFDPSQGIPFIGEISHGLPGMGQAEVKTELLKALREHQIIVAGTGPENKWVSTLGFNNPPGNFMQSHDYTVQGYDPETGRVSLRSPLALHNESKIPGYQSKEGQSFSVPFEQFYSHFQSFVHGASS